MLFHVATLTPFDARGRVDLGRLRAHVLWLASQGVDGFVATGSTGEFLYLSDREREAVHRTAIDAAMGRPVYPCPWDPSPATTAWLAEAARDHGAAGILLPPPLYYKLDDGVVARWYREIAAAARIPVLAYHNPDLLPTPVQPQLYATLRAEGVLAGIKDSSGDLFRLERLSTADPGAVLAGGDRILPRVPQLTQLGGFISALGNAWPSLCLRILRGEQQLEDALTDKAARIRRAGGLRALKAVLKMGCRMPLPEPEPELAAGLPASEFPG